jgi:hypothetical protein
MVKASIGHCEDRGTDEPQAAICRGLVSYAVSTSKPEAGKNKTKDKNRAKQKTQY